MPEPAEALLTAEEAAALLGVTRSYLYRMIKRGIIPEAVGIRNGREVKLIPASALERLNAHEGLLVRDVEAGPPTGGWQPAAAAPANAPAAEVPPPASRGGARPAWGPPQDTGASVTHVRPAIDANPQTVPPAVSSQPGTFGSLTGQLHDTEAQMMLISELREELRTLRQQLTEERTARQKLEAKLTEPAPVSDELASALRRTNEVTALVKASEIKQQRFFESLLEDRRWGRAKRIAYFTYLVITSVAGIAAVLWIYKMASHLEALLGR